ncbi:hypothetical protein [Saccharothrix stipae]
MKDIPAEDDAYSNIFNPEAADSKDLNRAFIRDILPGGIPSKQHLLERWLNNISARFHYYIDGVREVASKPPSGHRKTNVGSSTKNIGMMLNAPQRRQIEKLVDKIHSKVQESLDSQIEQLVRFNESLKEGKNRTNSKAYHPPTPDVVSTMIGLLVDPEEIEHLTKNGLDLDELSHTQKLYFFELHQARLTPSPDLILCQALLPAMTAQFEEYLSSTLRFALSLHPNAMNLGKKQISLEEVRRFQSTSDLERKLADKAVSDFISGSPEHWRKELDTWPGIRIDELSDNWAAFIEIFLRRNSVVHRASMADEKYLHLLPRELDAPPLGMPLIIDREYLLSAADRLECVAAGIFAMWPNKVARQFKIDTSASVAIRVYNALNDGRWTAAAIISSSFLQGWTDDDPQGVVEELRVNNWMARLEAFPETREEVFTEIDSWQSPEDLSFDIAKLLLKGEDAHALDLIKSSIQAGKLAGDQIAHWPLIKNLTTRTPSAIKILRTPSRIKVVGPRKRR